jgi:hypothetical protein
MSPQDAAAKLDSIQAFFAPCRPWPSGLIEANQLPLKEHVWSGSLSATLGRAEQAASTPSTSTPVEDATFEFAAARYDMGRPEDVHIRGYMRNHRLGHYGQGTLLARPENYRPRPVGQFVKRRKKRVAAAMVERQALDISSAP